MRAVSCNSVCNARFIRELNCEGCNDIVLYHVRTSCDAQLDMIKQLLIYLQIEISDRRFLYDIIRLIVSANRAQKSKDLTITLSIICVPDEIILYENNVYRKSSKL